MTETAEAVAGPRIGVWGTFDLENYGDMLLAFVVEEELLLRLPGSTVRRFSPMGHGRPNRFDAGRPAEELGPWSPDRVEEIARDVDLVVVGGGEIIHGRDELLAPYYGVSPSEMRERAPSRFFIEALGPRLEREVPVVWSSVGIPFDPEDPERLRRALEGRPYLAVRDEISQARLAALGVPSEVVPDPVVLLPRHWDRELLERRLRHLRAMGWYPESGWTLVVQGNAAGLPHLGEAAAAIDEIASRHEDATVVIVSTGPIYGDDEFAEALGPVLRTSVRRVPEAGLQDVAAVIALSDGFVGSSLHGNVTASAFGRPHAMLDWGRESKLRGFARLIEAEESLASPRELPEAFEKMEARGPRPEVMASLQDRVDRHVDRVAEMAREAAARRDRGFAGRLRPGAPGEAALRRALRDLREAYEARGRALAFARWATADEMIRREEEVRALREEVEWLRRMVADLRRQLAAREAHVEALLSSRTWRSTAWLRGLTGWARRVLGRG